MEGTRLVKKIPAQYLQIKPGLVTPTQKIVTGLSLITKMKSLD